MFYLQFNYMLSCLPAYVERHNEIINKSIEINTQKIINDVDPDAVGLPRNFLIDFKEKILRPSKDSLVRKISKINRVEHIENKLILQGVDEGVVNVDDGLAWSITISKKKRNRQFPIVLGL